MLFLYGWFQPCHKYRHSCSCVYVCLCVFMWLTSCVRVWMSVFFCFGFCYSQVQCEFHISTAYFRYTSTATASLLFKLTMYKKNYRLNRFISVVVIRERWICVVGYVWERRRNAHVSCCSLVFLQTTGGLSVWLP